MKHIRRAAMHLERQGKIERWHQPQKSRILLENDIPDGEHEAVIAALINRYNNHRCHESAGNLSPTTAVVVVTRTSWPKGNASDCILPQTAA